MPNDPEGRRGPVEIIKTQRNPLRDFTKMLSPDTDRVPVEVTENYILSILCVRRGREAAMGRELFSDPAWDILLELFAARLGCRRMTVDELARSIDMPRSTTARWIEVLSDRGLVTTVSDFGDRAKLWIELTAHGDATMTRLVDHWRSAFHSM